MTAITSLSNITQNYAPLTLIEGAEVVLPHGKPFKAKVVIQNNTITGVYQRLPDVIEKTPKTVFKAPEGTILTPGLIDQHNHGGYGVSFDTDNAKQMLGLMQKLPSLGITRILPTIMTNPLPMMKNAISEVETLAKQTSELANTTQVLGIHLEGPCLNLEKKAAHNATSITAANQDPEKTITELLSPLTKLITLAPETLKPELLQKLIQKGIKLSLGHSMASAKQTLEAIQNGVTGLTHIFNAMPAISHRKEYGNPGPIPVFSILPKKQVYTELIADGEHVTPWVIQFLLNIKHMAKKLVLVSDSCPLAGQPQNTSGTFSGETLKIKDGKAVNQKGVLSGSTQFVTQGIRNLMVWSKHNSDNPENQFLAKFKLPFEKAIQMATQNPATFLGMGHQFGKIQPGYIADLVLWNKNTLDVMATWINGKLVYQQPNTPSN